MKLVRLYEDKGKDDEGENENNVVADGATGELWVGKAWKK